MKYKSILLFIAILVLFASCSSEPQEEPATEFQYSCNSNDDCRNYVSANTCQVICANNDIDNSFAITDLEATCDSSDWDSNIEQNCVCAAGQCIVN